MFLRNFFQRLASSVQNTWKPAPPLTFHQHLHRAISNQNTAAIQALLISAFAENLNINYRDGFTPLILAINRLNIATVRLLLRTHQLDLTLMDSGGNTPLMHAAYTGCQPIVDELLGRIYSGTHLRLTCQQGYTAEELARIRGYHEIADKIKARLQSYPTYAEQIDALKARGAADISEDLCCPFSGGVMEDAIVLPSGHTVDRESMKRYYRVHGNPLELVCPCTKKDWIPIHYIYHTSTHVRTKRDIEKHIKTETDKLKQPAPVKRKRGMLFGPPDESMHHSDDERPRKRRRSSI